MPIAVPRSSPWDRQPGAGARVNRDHWAGRSIKHAIVGGIPFDVATGALFSLSTGSTISTGRFGRGFAADAFTWWTAQFAPWRTDPSSVSFVFVHDRNSSANNGWCEIGVSGSAAHFPWGGAAFSDAGTNYRWMNSIAAPSGKSFAGPSIIGISSRANQQEAYWDGSPWHSGSANTVMLPSTCSVGGDPRYGAFDGSTSLFLMADAFWTPEQHASLAANPWQIFA